jgi:hypothetical protein
MTFRSRPVWRDPRSHAQSTTVTLTVPGPLAMLISEEVRLRKFE